MSNVIDFCTGGSAVEDVITPVDGVISRAIEADLTSIVVLGFNRAGEFWSDTCVKDGGDVLWLLE